MRSTIGRGAAAAAFVLGALLPTAARAQSPAREQGDLASGPYATMRAKLERTLFDIDVLEVAIRFDEGTRRRLADAARGRPYSEERARRVAEAALGAERALVRVTFLRDVTLDQYLPGVRDDLRRAHEAGLLERGSYPDLAKRVPASFDAVEERGFRRGDRLYYDVRPRSVRTVLVAADGRVVAERLERGSAFRRAVLGSYFAPGTTFRELLIRSLF